MYPRWMEVVGWVVVAIIVTLLFFGQFLPFH